jgi:replication-associated recombination protein RarA
MSLLRLTVLSKNDDTGFAGTVLFNSKYMDKPYASGSNTVFFYRSTGKRIVKDKYIVSDPLSTVIGIYNPPAVGKTTDNVETFAVVTFRDDINDSTSSTTNKSIDLEDIVKGIALPSDTTQSILWLANGTHRTRKFLIDKFLKAFEDLYTTGTTTTYE